jgi:hypothetical protein
MSQTAIIEFLMGKGETVGNVYKHLKVVYRDCSVSRSTVVRWAKHVRSSERRNTNQDGSSLSKESDDTCLLGHERVILVKIMGKGTAVNSETYVATQQRHQRCVKFV